MRKSPNKMPEVTLIVCIYNVEQYIEHFLISVFSQSYNPISYVFVNDGTTDRSIAILEDMLNAKFYSMRDRVTIINKQNEGLPFARAEGLNKVTGDYFIFLDPDDWIEQDMIERMVMKAEDSASDMVYCDYFLEYPNRRVICREFKPCRPVNSAFYVSALYNIKGFHSYLVIKLFRSSILEDLNLFVPPENMMEDMVFSSQFISRCSRVEKVDLPLYHYNKTNPTALTRTKWKERRRQKGINLLGLLKHLELTNSELLPIISNTLLFWSGWCLLCSNGLSFFIKDVEHSGQLFHCHFENRCDTRFYSVKKLLLRFTSLLAVLLSTNIITKKRST